MSRNKKWMIIAGIGIIVLLITIWLVQVIRLNQGYHHEEQMISMGESVEYGNVVYTVPEAKIYDFEAFMYEYSDFAWTSGMMTSDIEEVRKEPNSIKILCYIVRMEVGEVDKYWEIPLTHQNTNGSWTNVRDYWLTSFLSGEELEQLTVNSIVELQIPVMLRKDAFSKEDWERLNQENCGLEWIVAYQPEQYGIYFDKVEHVYAGEEAYAYLEEVWKEIEDLEAGDSDPLTPKEENVFLEGKGTVDGITYEIGEISEIGVEELQGYDTENMFSSLNSINDPERTYRFFRTTATITNNTEYKQQISLLNTNISVVQEEAVCDSPQLLYMDYQQYEQSKAAGLLILNPGETVELELIYEAMWGSAVDAEMEQCYEGADYYFTVNNSGQFYDSINNKLVLFFLYEDGLQ